LAAAKLHYCEPRVAAGLTCERCICMVLSSENSHDARANPETNNVYSLPRLFGIPPDCSIKCEDTQPPAIWGMEQDNSNLGPSCVSTVHRTTSTRRIMIGP
jgi:hypothetical protein